MCPTSAGHHLLDLRLYVLGWVEENPFSQEKLLARVQEKLSFVERGFLSSLTNQRDQWRNRYQHLIGQTAAEEEATLQEAKDLVEEIRKFYSSIRKLDEPAQRTAAWERFCRRHSIRKPQLQAIVKEIIEADNPDNANYHDFDSLMAGKLGAEPLVEGFLPRSRVVLLAADGGCSKSTLMYQLAAAASSGTKFLGMFVSALTRVLFYQVDEPASDAQDKLRKMDLAEHLSGNPNFRIQWAFTPGKIADLEEEILRDGRELVIMDSFTTIFGGSEHSLNDAEIALHLYELQRIASRTNCTIVITHHLNQGSLKGSKTRTRTDIRPHELFGSAFILNACSDVWGIWKTDEGTGDHPRYRMKKLKNRSRLCPDGQIYDLEGDVETLRHTLVDGVGDESIVLARTLKEGVLGYLQQHKGQFFGTNLLTTELQARNNKFTSISADSVRRVLTSLYSQGHKTRVTRRKLPASSSKTGRRGSQYGIE